MAEQTRIRVMTVDDHEIMRGGIRFVLLAFDDLELVAEARSGEEAVRLCAEAKPDVVLMDMKMPEMDGIATTKAIKEVCPETQVLVLTSFHDKDLVHRAMQAGAVGYLLKDASKDELADAIRAAKSGRPTLSPEAADDLVGASAAPAQFGQELTDKEREVLTLLAKRLSNNPIAEQLHRSPFTVRHHVSQIIAKLGVANRARQPSRPFSEDCFGEALALAGPFPFRRPKISQSSPAPQADNWGMPEFWKKTGKFFVAMSQSAGHTLAFPARLAQSK